MDQVAIKKMISDLENLGTYKRDDPDMIAEEPVEPDDTYRKPTLPPPPNLREKLLARIAQEPARVTTDPQGRITSVNPAFTKLCGFSFSEIAGKKPGPFLQGEATDPACAEELHLAIQTGTPCHTELINYHKDGTQYCVRIDLQPVRDDDGNLIGFEATEKQIAPTQHHPNR